MSEPEIRRPLTPLRESIHKIYAQAGLFDANGTGCKFYRPCAASCTWSGPDRYILPMTGAFVGDQFGKNTTRVMFIGLNTNRGSNSLSEFYASYDWISAGKENIAKCFFRVCKKVFDVGGATPDQILPNFAFANIIKCSVKGLAGKPTDVMEHNCVIRQGIVFQEMDILKPEVIFSIGKRSFGVIRNHFIDTAEAIIPQLTDWLYLIKVKGRSIPVILLQHPPMGYQRFRDAYKKIEAGTPIPASLKIFQPQGVEDSRGLNSWLNKKYPEDQRHLRIDTANPFYDLIFDTLWDLARKHITHRRED